MAIFSHIATIHYSIVYINQPTLLVVMYNVEYTAFHHNHHKFDSHLQVIEVYI